MLGTIVLVVISHHLVEYKAAAVLSSGLFGVACLFIWSHHTLEYYQNAISLRSTKVHNYVMACDTLPQYFLILSTSNALYFCIHSRTSEIHNNVIITTASSSLLLFCCYIMQDKSMYTFHACFRQISVFYLSHKIQTADPCKSAVWGLSMILWKWDEYVWSSQ